MIEINELLESALSNIENLKLDQKQELFEAIRHLTKYRGYALVSNELKVPDMAHKLQDKLKILYEEQYESK